MTIRTEPQFSEAALEVLQQRYLQPGESPGSMLERVSWGNSDYYEMMARLDFLPNSPTLFNGGLDGRGTLSACFKLDIPDSMEGIMEVARKASLILKYGGGVGYVFSGLRPRGSPVHTTHREAGGPVQFMKVYQAVADAVAQGGVRPGAQMAILHCDHQDIEEFIHCKDTVEKAERFSTFNISVACTDEFMQKQRALIHSTGNDSLLLWKMAEAAWATGDPGCYFIDHAEAANPTPWLGKLTGTNPCFTGDTKVWTLFGPMRFDELVGQETQVLSQDSQGHMVFRKMHSIRRTQESAHVYRVVTKGLGRYSRIGEFRATADHQVMLADGSWTKVIQLEPGSRLASVYRHKANSKGYLKLSNSFSDSDMEHRIVAAWNTDMRPDYPEYHVDHIDGVKTNNLPGNLRVLPHAEHNSLNMRGTNNPVNRMPWVNNFNYRDNKGPGNGMYGKRHSSETIEKLRQVNHTVVSVEYVGEAPVYDGEVEDTHQFFILTEDNGGVLVHNCGEVPLLDGEPCNLGSINLGHFVKAENVDWTRLESVVRLATRYLDDTLDHNIFPDQTITDAALLTRKLGLGVMGWADMLCLLRIPYDSERAVKIARELMYSINSWAEQESIHVAYAKGRCPAFDLDTLNLWPRNATRTCIAPTGSISILADASSGIEPHYALEWEHRMANGTVLKRKPWAIVKSNYTPKTAMEIEPKWHLEHQAAFQEHTDLAVSKTINLPSSATVQDIYQIYYSAWEKKCKGVTVFRDGCRGEQVLTNTLASDNNGPRTPSDDDRRTPEDTGLVSDTANLDSSLRVERTPVHGAPNYNAPTAPYDGQETALPSDPVTLPIRRGTSVEYGLAYPTPARRRLPDTRSSVTHKFVVGGQEGYMTVGLYDNGEPGELFITVGKEGNTIAGLLDSLGILVSIALQYGVPIGAITSKLRHTTFEPHGITHNLDIPTATSIVDYMVHWLEHRFVPGAEKQLTYTPVQLGTTMMQSGLTCPECGSLAIVQEGCLACSNQCGWSRCG